MWDKLSHKIFLSLIIAAWINVKKKSKKILTVNSI